MRVSGHSGAAALQTIRHFEIVQTLAAHRHFGRAASALGVSQPSLTRSLNRIEELAGGPLFDRSGVTPTIFGKIVLKYGSEMLANRAALSRELLLTRGLDVGEISVAMGPYAADVSGNAAAGVLSKRHPSVAIELRIMDWPRGREAVLSGAADLAFGEIREAVNSADLDVYPVRSGSMSFFCAAGHPLTRRSKISFDDLTRYPWTGPSLPPSIGALMPEGERPCYVVDKGTGRLRPRILVESFAAAKRVVASGEAISASLPFQVKAEVAAGELVVLSQVDFLIDLRYGFVLKRDRTVSPATKAFMKIVRTIEEAIPR